VSPAPLTRPIVLVILDGWGVRAERDFNAIALARTPVYTELLERFPHTTLEASGAAVGLPAGQMGNSEVGHMNMGAGRVVYQDLTRIDKSIADGDFFTNPTLLAAMERCRSGRSALHLIGLASDGGVHSHLRHLIALLEMAARQGVPRVFVHAFTDGRDTPPTSGVGHLAAIEDAAARLRVGRLATVVGRYYAMDRDKRWPRTRRAYDLLTRGVGEPALGSAAGAMQASYARGVTDEFVEPIAITDADLAPIGPIRDGDSIVCVNFRADRVRQITRALAFSEFDGFERVVRPSTAYVCLTEYDQTFGLPVVFRPETFSGSFAEALAAAGLGNLRLAETEKYAHVTYFFNCGEERPYPGEDRILVPSPHVPTYDLQPEMSAAGITDELTADLAAGRHDVVICNFANADMVGHTGKLEAAIAAVETLDRCLGRIVAEVRRAGGVAAVTADHGNAEQMWDPITNGPHTAHTSNPVPFVLVDGATGSGLRRGGALCDVAPTLMGLLGLSPPREMTGRDLRVL
jgi:2,3-bisphosphoglycerate-independent phosphoglycerate mutase